MDILIYHDGKPFIVIECKRQIGYNKNKEHIKQAIRHENTDTIRAEFYVFTDEKSGK